MDKIGEVIARVRNTLKLDSADVRLTDRDIYSLMIKHREWLVKREDEKLRAILYPEVIQSLYMELIDVDLIECSDIRSDCTIKRTKDRLPNTLAGTLGALIRNVKSIDGTQIVQMTTSASYARKQVKSNFKYDKNKYFFHQNGYLYFPNLDWEAVIVEAFFSHDVGSCEITSCLPRQEQLFRIPAYLQGELESFLVKDLAMYLQIPQETLIDKNENNK